MVLLNVGRAARHHVGFIRRQQQYFISRSRCNLFDAVIVTKPFRVQLDLLFERPSYYLHSLSAGSYQDENHTKKAQTKIPY